MRTRKDMHALFILLTVMMMSVVVVSAVSASDTEEYFEHAIVEDPEGMELVRYSQTLSNPFLGAKSVYDWTAYTNIWHLINRIHSDQYSKSRDHDTGYPFDIDTIGVRARIWEDDDPRFDQTDTNYNAADAEVSYETTGDGSAHWFARSNHTFEYVANNDYWYPVTEDEFNE